MSFCRSVRVAAILGNANPGGSNNLHHPSSFHGCRKRRLPRRREAAPAEHFEPTNCDPQPACPARGDYGHYPHEIKANKTLIKGWPASSCGLIVAAEPSLKTLKFLPAVFIRGIHSQKITQNLQYISNDVLDLKIDKKSLKSESPLDRPLCVMLSWMASKRKHLMKYADIYLEMGFDVTTVTISPLQLMFPTRGSQVIAAELMSFLESNQQRPVVVHGFSVGAYVWAELLVHALKDLQRYQAVLDRVAAQVWDSPADVEEMPNGLSHSLFPNNQFMQKVIKAYAKTHMKVLHRVATQYYWRATQAYHEPPCTAPSLFLVSETDPISPARRARRASQLMTAMGIKCNWQCWEDSPHVLHYSHHREEYLAALYSHLEECGLLQSNKKGVAMMQ